MIRRHYDKGDDSYSRSEFDYDDNLYSLPDDEENGVEDNSSLRDKERGDGDNEEGEGYDEEEEYDDNEIDGDDGNDADDEDESEGKRGNKRGNAIFLLLKILATPVEGWKELKRRRYRPEEFAKSCFLPLTLLASLSEFAGMFYDNALRMNTVFMEALNVFISLFFGYFTVLLLAGYLLPEEGREAMKKVIGKEFVMVVMSSLALFRIGYNLLPMIDPVLVFLPLWTIYLICKGIRILRVPKEKEVRIETTLSLLAIGSPILWQWLFGILF